MALIILKFIADTLFLHFCIFHRFSILRQDFQKWTSEFGSIFQHQIHISGSIEVVDIEKSDITYPALIFCNLEKQKKHDKRENDAR